MGKVDSREGHKKENKNKGGGKKWKEFGEQSHHIKFCKAST